MIKGRVSMIIVVLNAYWTPFSEAVSFNVVWFFRRFSHFDWIKCRWILQHWNKIFIKMPGIRFECVENAFLAINPHTHAYVFMRFNCEQHIFLILNVYDFFMKSNLASYCFVRTRIILQVTLAKSQDHKHKNSRLLLRFSSWSDQNAIK